MGVAACCPGNASCTASSAGGSRRGACVRDEDGKGEGACGKGGEGGRVEVPRETGRVWE